MRTRSSQRRRSSTCTVAIDLAMSPPPAGRSRWTTRLLGKAVGLSAGCISDILRRNGLKPHLVRTYKVSRDPAFTANYSGGTVVGLGSFSSGARDISYPSVPGPLEPGSPGAALNASAGDAVNGVQEVDPEWTQVYQDFVRIKQDCGEAVEGFTFERFTQTLRKNRDTLMREHGVQHVQFSAYVKQGRAALKAKPVRQ